MSACEAARLTPRINCFRLGRAIEGYLYKPAIRSQTTCFSGQSCSLHMGDQICRHNKLYARFFICRRLTTDEVALRVASLPISLIVQQIYGI
eukprot:scaffold465580_cov41-Prasinocladus_malaysianus.AAC.1